MPRGGEVFDRHFLYLDHDRVRGQLSQHQRTPQTEIQKRTTAAEGGGVIAAKVAGAEVSGARKRQHTHEVELQFQDRPERMFATYHDVVTNAGLVTCAATDAELPPGGIVAGQLYELRGQMTAADAGDRGSVPATLLLAAAGDDATEPGPVITFQLARQYWTGDGPVQYSGAVVLFGVGLGGQVAGGTRGALWVMAAYLPPGVERPAGATGQQAAAAVAHRPSRRTMLAAAAGVAAAGGLAATGFLVRGTGAPAGLRPVRVAGGPGEYFDHPEVKNLFREHGLAVEQTEFGSRQIADLDLTRYDAVFPASALIARHIQDGLGRRWVQYPSFGSPMIVVSWQPIAELLEDIGIARRQDGIWIFDVKAYLANVDRGTRWTDAGTGYAVDQRVLLRTTDPAFSNSGAMFIAIASNALTNNDVVSDPADVARLVPRIKGCFAFQGDKHTTTTFLLEAYRDDGMGVVPIGLAYENDAVRERLRHPELVKAKRMVAMYPEPNVLSEHYLIPVRENRDSERVGDLLQSDPALLGIAQNTFGYRFGLANSDNFAHAMAAHGITVPDNHTLTGLGLGPIPTNDILGRFIDAIEPTRRKPN